MGVLKMKIAVLGHVHMSAEPHSTLQQTNNIVAFTQLTVHSNAIVLVYFVLYFHYLCSVTHSSCIPSKRYGRKKQNAIMTSV